MMAADGNVHGTDGFFFLVETESSVGSGQGSSHAHLGPTSLPLVRSHFLKALKPIKATPRVRDQLFKDRALWEVFYVQNAELNLKSCGCMDYIYTCAQTQLRAVSSEKGNSNLSQ